ncbi:MAG: hypothetical protein C5B51_27555 [Terriglobia bacterium]|nr:MAG: hypothetical protein C5B51_27555 [Terriglobia bacterium]
MKARRVTTYAYDPAFFRYLDVGACRSAAVIVPLIEQWFPISSILDIGCGSGVWVAEWLRRGAREAIGIDGSYVEPASLLIPVECFRPRDLSQPFSLGRRFDLVQCLEVGEHIPARFADVFLDNIVAHGDRVLFSAAAPGQGGEHHVNERPIHFWREQFAARGYRAFDALRPAIRGRTEVEPWYRYNPLLYVREDRSNELPAEILQSELPAGSRIPEMAPFPWRLRRAILARLPQHTVSRMSVVKHHVFNLSRKLQSR